MAGSGARAVRAMPDESRTRLARLRAWWRRGHDAELLAVAPIRDRDGTTLTWDFPHPVNHSRLWVLLRPWVSYPLLFAVFAMVIPPLIHGHGLPVSFYARRLLWVGLVSVVLAWSIHKRQRPRIERMALKAYHAYRWRGTRALDVAIAEARTRGDRRDR
jgi:hypothetical protein